MCRTHFVCKDDRKSASTEALFLKKKVEGVVLPRSGRSKNTENEI